MNSSRRPSRSPSVQQQPPDTPEKPSLDPKSSNPYNPNSAAYLAYPVKHVVSSLYRRMTEPPDQPVGKLLDAPSANKSAGVYTPPKRTQSPFQPPPLTPLELSHQQSADTDFLLTRSLAEEIRLLIPPRLQLVEQWRLAYSLELHGSSLATLYDHCSRIAARSQRAGYVLVVHDATTAGSLFGAYLTDAPKVSPHYYGTGECFLWRAAILPSLRSLPISSGTTAVAPSSEMLQLAGLPPPPSADTTHAQRTTTVRSERSGSRSSSKPSSPTSPRSLNKHLSPPSLPPPGSGASTPDRIRFKAFPYSGENDFMIYCTSNFLSVGGGNGHYGLWLDDTLESGLSESCPTFGNEALSEDGRKFDVLDVEIWYVGA